jgi:hypothetical protein
VRRLPEEDEGLGLDGVASELRSVLTQARTLTALRSLDLPHLDSILRRIGIGIEDFPDLLERAIRSLDDPLYRSAAEDLFPLPYRDDAPWPKLAARGRSAGARFGIGYDGFRRAGGGRPSRLDEVLWQIALALGSIAAQHHREQSPAEHPQSEQSPAAHPQSAHPQSAHPRSEHPQAEHSPSGPTGEPPPEVGPSPADRASPVPPVRRPGGIGGAHRRQRLIVGVGVVVAITVAAVAVAVAVNGGPSPRRQAASFVPSGCDQAVGRLDAELSREPAAERISIRLADTFRTAAAASAIGCPTRPAYRWEAIVVQELTRLGRGDGALLISPNGIDLYLNNAQWGSYHQIGGRDGLSAQPTAGFPLQVVPYSDGHVEVDFSLGVVMVGEREDAPYFWIPAAFVGWWRENQTVTGLPTGNPLPTFRQDFQRGFVTVEPPTVGVPVLTTVDPRQDLPTIDTIRERVLEHADGTSWFVTAEGTRQWIPDGQTFECLDGEAKRLRRNLPGYAIATLAFAGQAVCPP